MMRKGSEQEIRGARRNAPCREQEIEMFSEISGIAFTPDDSSLMISLQEEMFGGFMQYKRMTKDSQVLLP